MKRILFVAIILVSCACHSFASNDELPKGSKVVYFEPVVGAEILMPGDMTTMGYGVTTFNTGGGWHFGCHYDLRVNKHIFISPGTIIYYNSFSMKDKLAQSVDKNVEHVWYERWGLRIPVHFGYRWSILDDKGLSLFTGPELQVGIAGYEMSKYEGIKYKQSLYSDDIGFRRIGTNWIAGIKFDFSRITITASGGFGMVNLVRFKNISLKEYRINLGIGYVY